MILLSMVIMNLSVAAVIEGLAEASKENMGIVSGDQIDFLIDRWKDYDTNASGLISYQDLLFLLYEVPPPLGIGKFTNYYSDQNYEGEIGQQEKDDEERKDDLKNINNLGLQDRYMIHKEKKIYIKKSDAIKIFNDYAIPLYEDNKVHFKDVAKALVEKIFKKNKLSYDLTGKIKNRLNKQWEGKYNTLKKINPREKVNTGLFEAGRAIFKFYKRAKGNKEVSVIKRGKSMTKTKENLQVNQKLNTSSKKKEEQEEKKHKDEEMFTNQRIEKFLEKGQTEEIKNDKSYDPFRYLMNERNMAYDQDLYATENRDKSDAKNQFTWFKDPNFKFQRSDSSEDEEMHKLCITFRNTAQIISQKKSTLHPSRVVSHPRKSVAHLDISKLEMMRNSTMNKSKDNISTKEIRQVEMDSSNLLKCNLKHPNESNLFIRRNREAE